MKVSLFTYFLFSAQIVWDMANELLTILIYLNYLILLENVRYTLICIVSILNSRCESHLILF